MREWKQWTEQEDKIILENYLDGGRNKCFELLEGRHTKEAITARAQKFNLVRTLAWTKEEEEIILNNYIRGKRGSLQECYELLGCKRSKTAIVAHIRDAHLMEPIVVPSWTKEQEDIILKNYNNTKASVKKCSELLDGKKTDAAIIQRASKLGLTKYRKCGFKSRRWAKEEDEFLFEHYLTDMQPAEVAERLKRTKDAVRARADFIGIPRKKDIHVAPFTKEELEKIDEFASNNRYRQFFTNYSYCDEDEAKKFFKENFPNHSMSAVRKERQKRGLGNFRGKKAHK